ncbi:MAG: hypothetical protein ABII79_11830 [bacterium]
MYKEDQDLTDALVELGLIVVVLGVGYIVLRTIDRFERKQRASVEDLHELKALSDQERASEEPNNELRGASEEPDDELSRCIAAEAEGKDVCWDCYTIEPVRCENSGCADVYTGKSICFHCPDNDYSPTWGPYCNTCV